MGGLTWLDDRLRLPLIAAPMYGVSGPDLVIAACRAGIVGAFPTSNCRTVAELDAWLDAMMAAARGAARGMVCPNLIIRQARLADDLDRLVSHRVEMVITSVGSPAAVIEPLHRAGARVFADVASVAHARKAIAAGADGLVLLTAGAGGNTGWANPFAFARAVRAFHDGPIVLSGGICDGASLRAARVLGCDLAYMGTRFIASDESMATPAYRQALIAAELDDIVTTRAFTGIASTMMRSAIVANGLDPDALDETVTAADVRAIFGAGSPGPRRWTDLWSAGHSVSGVGEVASVAAIVDRIAKDYEEISTP